MSQQFSYRVTFADGEHVVSTGRDAVAGMCNAVRIHNANRRLVAEALGAVESITPINTRHVVGLETLTRAQVAS